MNNNRVLAGLKHCATADDCIGCPYHSTDYCTKHMCADALALFEELMAKPTTHESKPKVKYHTAIVYSKHTSLLPWFNANSDKFRGIDKERFVRIREHYSKERDVELILLLRHEDGVLKCLIRCPVNPLPIKGEFTPTLTQLYLMLDSLGWTYKGTLRCSMFN